VKTPKFSFKKPNFDLEKLKRTSLKVVTMLARTSLPEILFIATFVINHFLTNDDFSYPHELVVPILLLGILASIFSVDTVTIFSGIFSPVALKLVSPWP
jgi:hypothetical protein